MANFNSTLPLSFGADFCAGDTTMRSIFAGCQIQLTEFMAARARLAGDKSMLDFMPAVRADKLALGLHDIADSIYKLAANWRSLIASAQTAIGSEANNLTNARNTLSADRQSPSGSLMTRCALPWSARSQGTPTMRSQIAAPQSSARAKPWTGW